MGFWSRKKRAEPIITTQENLTPGIIPTKQDIRERGFERKRRHRKTREIHPTEGEYIPLPKAPNTWEEKEARAPWETRHRETVSSGDLFNRRQQYQKSIEIFKRIPPEDRRGKNAKKMSIPYRHLIDRAIKNRRFSEGLKWASEFMAEVPESVTNTDRKRFNKMIDGISEQKKPHNYEKLNITPEPDIPLFEVESYQGWNMVSTKKLRKDEKPYTAYKKYGIVQGGLLSWAHLGKTEEYPDAPAAVKVTSMEGAILSDFPLPHDVYRMYTNPVVPGFATLSKNCQFNAYDLMGRKTYSEDLSSMCESVNHLRCVGMTPAFDKLLFTAVDEAWCVDGTGKDIWAVGLPPKPGWEKIGTKSYHTQRDHTRYYCCDTVIWKQDKFSSALAFSGYRGWD